MRPHTVLILLYTSVYAAPGQYEDTHIYRSIPVYVCVLILSSYYYICVLILLYMCPHTAIYVSSYYYICVLILLYMCPHTAIYMSSYCYICVLILLYMWAYPVYGVYGPHAVLILVLMLSSYCCPHAVLILLDRIYGPHAVLILLYMCVSHTSHTYAVAYPYADTDTRI
jgi:hypothetical protein